jgi:hypothetical protein
MTETRKLAAILAADVVGYSRLAGADEDRTLARLRALRSDLIDPTIAVHHGRVVKRTGDGISLNSAAWSMPCAAPSRYRTAWSSVTQAFRPSAASSSASEFMSSGKGYSSASISSRHLASLETKSYRRPYVRKPTDGLHVPVVRENR